MARLKLQPERNLAEPDAIRLGRLFLPGAMVGGWVVAGVLREEPDHVLYEATLGSGGAPATLKLTDPTVFHDARYYKLQRRAVRRWKRVENPHLARVLDAGKSPDGPYLATEPVAGRPLALELESGPLPHARAAQITLELGRALDAVLAAGMAPGALTPREVVLGVRGAVVTDPGVGRARQTEGMIEADEALDYLSPEEAVGAPPVPQSAVYSLACIAYQCLIGEPPYPREAPQAVLYAHVADPPALPHARDRSLPKELDGVFERAMALDPDERQPTPGAFARSLEAALSLPDEHSPAPAATERPALVVVPDVVEPEPLEPLRIRPEPAKREALERPPGSSRRLLRPLAAVVAAAACATAGFAIGSSGGPESPVPAVPVAEAGPPAGPLAAAEVVKRLDDNRTALRARLAQTRTRTGQAKLARRLSRVYATTARRAPAATPADLGEALRESSGAYARLASAARAGKAPAWASARAGVARAEDALAGTLRDTSTTR